MHAYCMGSRIPPSATPAARELAEQLEFRARAAVKMIATPVVALRESDQLAADAGRSGSARQFAHLAGHLAAMIAVGKRGRRLALCRRCQIAGNQKPAGGTNNPIAQIPTRVFTISVVIHTRPTNLPLLPNAADNYREYA
jgi:hypothetical protein